MPRTHIRLPSPAPGTERRLTVYRYGSPGARPKAYFQAALHADELPALLVAHHLRHLLEQAAAADLIRGEVIVVPVANPIGLDQQWHGTLLGRFDFGASGNFNRQFPELPTAAMLADLASQLGQDATANVALVRRRLLAELVAQPGSSPVTALKRALLQLAIEADLVFDLHCDSEALLHLYAPQRHPDLAAQLGAELGAEVVLLEENSGGLPFDEAVAGPWWKLHDWLDPTTPLPLACFATTVELRGQADVTDADARQDAANLYRFLQRQGVLSGDPGPLPAARCVATPLTGVDVAVAPAAGVVVYHKALGARVAAGETIAELVDPLADDPAAARTPIHSRTSGILFTRLAQRLARPGQHLIKIAGVEPLAHRQAGQLLLD